MEKFTLSPAHLEKRAQRKRFVLRYDTLGAYAHGILPPDLYFDLYEDIPAQTDKVILDMMFSGDWHSMYPSKILPRRRGGRIAQFYEGSVDLFGEWVERIHKKGLDCWLSHRISEVDIDTAENPNPVKEEHPDWFLPAFGYTMNNMAIPELHAHKLRVLEEIFRTYDFDGLDIDFERHTPILPVGKQWELREHVTDFMRSLRAMLLQIGEEKGKVLLLSARVPDCLAGCHTDGLDIETWVKEDLVDCLTLGSRSFDIKVEEFRALSPEIQLYGGYDSHHTVDGYLFPTAEIMRGIWYTHLQRGADGVEYFNWTGEGNAVLLQKLEGLAETYHLLPDRDLFPLRAAQENFTGANDRAFLQKQDKTYVLDRRGGYPWGIGYGNLNADRQLPCFIESEGSVRLYVPENAGTSPRATLRILCEEFTAPPELYWNGRKITGTAQPHRDLQVTIEAEAPISGGFVSNRLAQGVDLSKPCTLITADVTGIDTQIGYNTLRLVTKTPLSLEKVELDVAGT